MQELDRSRELARVSRKLKKNSPLRLLHLSPDRIMLHFWRSTNWSACSWPQPNRKRVRFGCSSFCYRRTLPNSVEQFSRIARDGWVMVAFGRQVPPGCLWEWLTRSYKQWAFHLHPFTSICPAKEWCRLEEDSGIAMVYTLQFPLKGHRQIVLEKWSRCLNPLKSPTVCWFTPNLWWFAASLPCHQQTLQRSG